MTNKKEIVIPKGTNLNGNKRTWQLEEALQERAEFRFNVLTRFPEIRFLKSNGKYSSWRRINDYILNSLVRDLRKSGLGFASRNNVSELIESTFSKGVNPIHEYFHSLPVVEGDPIGELACTVESLPWPNAGELPQTTFRKYLEKWLVGAVAGKTGQSKHPSTK